MYCILEDALRNKKPQWPYWLCPTQIRICPVSEKFNEKAINFAEELNDSNIRADVDDRNETLPKKISDSEREWVPYVIVFGEKEINSNIFPLRDRLTGKIENLDKIKLIKNILEKQNKMPWKPLPINLLLSKRPVFYG